MRCPSCQHQCPPSARFCMQCGSAISIAPPAPAKRRQLTVMFCDLVGSTTLSRTLDREEFRDLLGSYQSAACEVIRELRAALRLSSCWHRQGRTHDAARQLREVLADLEDGQDAEEIAEARSLLESWGERAGNPA